MIYNGRRHHTRTISSFTGKTYYDNVYHEVPLRPTRSAPSTWKKSRRNVGDTVSITSPSNVYIDYNKKYSINLVNKSNEVNSVNSPWIHENKDNLIKKTDFPKIKNTIFEDSLESQEICFYLVDSCPDHHYGSVYIENGEEGDHASFESDCTSEQSLKSDEEDNLYYNQLPKLPNSQPYNFMKFAGKHMKKFKRRSINLSKSLSKMTKKMPRTDPNVPINNENMHAVQAKENQCRTLESKHYMPKITAMCDNIGINNDEMQKSCGEQEKGRLSFLKRIRRSMSISNESALELTSKLNNRPRSTFYITETIDIDKKENNPALPYDNTKLNTTKPNSQPSPALEKNADRKETSKGNEGDVYKYNTRWYTEIGLYDYSNTTPSTSTAEQSPSSNKIRIDQDSDRYNMNNSTLSPKMNVSKYNGKSNLNELPTNNSPDIQLLLQDEPLYQFYDAAILESIFQDGAFKSESEHYEEVNHEFSELNSNLNGCSDDLSLAKKTSIGFTKTLWCEIPEVIQSSILDKLSIRQKKLQEAKFEIITSEASYLNSLNVLHNHFALNLQEYNCINEKEWEVMFGKIASVKACSEQLLDELEKCWNDNILIYGICDILLKHVKQNFNVYIPYCENQILLGDTLKQLMERPDFAKHLRDLETCSECQFLTLYSFLMLPMQRITRWPLLVDAVLKRLAQTDPEYAVCQYALATLNKVVNQCNEAARKKEREVELQTIVNKLEFPNKVIPINIISRNRWLIRSGPVVNLQPKSQDSKMTFRKQFNKCPLFLYLFNDLFVVTKENSDGSYSILHYCPRNLVELSDSGKSLFFTKKEGHERNFLFLTILENQEGKSVEFTLSCNKESDKERWIEAISPPKSVDPEESLYECWDCPQVMALHNYITVQPDELSLSQGDVVNVLRKMTDGWYHGERIRDRQTGWFPANYTSEIINPHVKARNLKQRYRLLAFSEKVLKPS